MKIPKVLLLTAATLAASLFPNSLKAQASSNVHVWVTGLNGPRGLILDLMESSTLLRPGRVAPTRQRVVHAGHSPYWAV